MSAFLVIFIYFSIGLVWARHYVRSHGRDPNHSIIRDDAKLLFFFWIFYFIFRFLLCPIARFLDEVVPKIFDVFGAVLEWLILFNFKGEKK